MQRVCREAAGSWHWCLWQVVVGLVGVRGAGAGARGGFQCVMQESGERRTMHEGLVLVACIWTCVGERTHRHKGVLVLLGARG